MASLASPSLRGMGVEDQISINWRMRAHPHYVLRRVEPNRQARGNQEKYSVFYPYSARRQILPAVSRSIPVEHGAGWRACSCDVAKLVLSGGHLTSAPLFLFVWRMPFINDGLAVWWVAANKGRDSSHAWNPTYRGVPPDSASLQVGSPFHEFDPCHWTKYSILGLSTSYLKLPRPRHAGFRPSGQAVQRFVRMENCTMTTGPAHWR